MAIQIINCPSCGTFLLEDTAQCHACGHILNANRAATTQRRSLPTDVAVDKDMDSCVVCGEACRKGLVRCWNCGSFMRPDIEAAYRQRAESPTAKFDNQFDLPVLDATSVTESDAVVRRMSTPESLLDAPPVAQEIYDNSDDFELADDIHLSEADESSFDLSDSVHLRSEGAAYDDSSLPDAPLALESYQVPSTPEPVEPETFRLKAEPEPITAPVPVQKTPVAEIPVAAVAPVPDKVVTAPAKPVAVQKKTVAAPLAAEKPAVPEPAPAVPTEPLSPDEELLKIASDEEAEISDVKKGQRTKDTFVVYCPQGHRIRVRDKFRGKQGKCPKCAAVFIVPDKQSDKPKKKTDVEFATVGGDSATEITGRYSRWLTDIRLHTVFPEKLKIKADSLLNDFQSVDIGFSTDEIVFVTLVAAGGLFGGAAKKKPAVRTAMLAYFATATATPDGLTAAAKRVVAKNVYPQIVLAQPVPHGTESLFGDIPVFGTGRIAVRLPRATDDKQTQYVSFSLSEFRVFAYAIQAICGIEEFGSNAPIPLTDQFDTFKCHYTETPVLALKQIEYYEKDPNLKLEVSGWKCSTCGLIVSEAGRAKEKIGGLNGKGIAKAKCPKCSQKFGSNPMSKIAETPAAGVPAAAPAAEAAPAETPATAEA